MDTMYGRPINKNEALILIENNDIASIITKNGEYEHIIMVYSSYWKNADDILSEQSMIDLIHNMSKYCYDKNNNRLYCY